MLAETVTAFFEPVVGQAKRKVVCVKATEEKLKTLYRHWGYFNEGNAELSWHVTEA